MDPKVEKLVSLVWEEKYNEVKLLLESGVSDINAQNEEGWNALQAALFSNNIEIIKLLLSHPDIDINVSRDGEPALFLACQPDGEPANLEIVDMFLNNPKVNVNFQNEKGNTILIELCYEDFPDDDLIKFLIESGKVDCNIKNNQGHKAIDVIEPDSKSFEYLIKCSKLHTLGDKRAGKAYKTRDKQKIDATEISLAFQQLDPRLDALVIEKLLIDSEKVSTLDLLTLTNIIDGVIISNRKIRRKRWDSSEMNKN